MSDWGKFTGETKEINIEGHAIIIKPLKVRRLDVMLGLSAGKDGAVNALKEMAILSLQQAEGGFPDLTKEEFEDTPLCHYRTVIDAVLDVNNLVVSEEVIKKATKQFGT